MSVTCVVLEAVANRATTLKLDEAGLKPLSFTSLLWLVG